MAPESSPGTGAGLSQNPGSGRPDSRKTGLHAAGVARTHYFDLFLTDLIMPCTDGIEAIISLRSRLNTNPFIAMSGGWHGIHHSTRLPLCGGMGFRFSAGKKPPGNAG